jgi:small GTP-binding protein
MDTPSTSDSPTFKVALIGDDGVGKTTLVRLLATGEHDEGHYVATLGAKVYLLCLHVHSRATGKTKEVHLNVWDTAGQERFGAFTVNHYLGSDGAVVCVGMKGRAGSLPKLAIRNVHTFRRSFVEVCLDAPIVLAVLKVDTQLMKRDETSITTLTRKMGVHSSHLVSSRTGLNIYEPFLALVRLFLKDGSIIFAPEGVELPRGLLMKGIGEDEDQDE